MSQSSKEDGSESLSTLLSCGTATWAHCMGAGADDNMSHSLSWSLLPLAYPQTGNPPPQCHINILLVPKTPAQPKRLPSDTDYGHRTKENTFFSCLNSVSVLHSSVLEPSISWENQPTNQRKPVLKYAWDLELQWGYFLLVRLHLFQRQQ